MSGEIITSIGDEDSTQNDLNPNTPQANQFENPPIEWLVVWHAPMTELGKMDPTEIDVEDVDYFAG